MAKHFVAVSTNAEAVAEFGIDTDNMLEFWDWVGGRYSYDSAIGFSLMVAIGREAFGEMLAGFHAIDEHFRTAPLGDEPAGHPGHAQRLVQQLLRRPDPRRAALQPSAGPLPGLPAAADHGVQRQVGPARRHRRSRARPARSSGASPGTNGQHAFYQLIHQGTKLIPADFIAFAESTHDDGDQQDLLMANCLAQTKALAFGKTAEEIAAEGTPRRGRRRTR